MNLEDAQTHLNVLYYGESGTGKTTALAGMANLGRILYVNAEAGLKAAPLRRLGVDIGSIDVWPEGTERVSYDALEQLHIKLLKNPTTYIGVVWDSITDIYQTILEGAVGEAYAKSIRKGMERDRFFIDRSDYGTMTEQMRQLTRRYRDLPMHFGIAALSRREQDNDGAVVYQPAITPALQTNLIGWVDVVGHTTLAVVGSEQTEEYRGQFRPAGKYRGKDRFKVLPRFLVTPSFDRVVAYVEGELSADEDPVMIEARALRDAANTQETETE